MTTAVVALLDGTLIGADQPSIHADDHGLLRGDGIFETTLVVDGEPRDLDEHLARLSASARLLELPVPAAQAWYRGVTAVLAGWSGGREMVLRLIATRGRETSRTPTCLVMGDAVSAATQQQRHRGISVLLLDRGFTGADVAAMPWLLTGAKTLSYAVNAAARRYAAIRSADDAIFVGTDGHILEGTMANVVIARDRMLITPPGEGILAGITIRRLFREAGAAGWETRTAPLTAADLTAADGLWLVSGVRLLAPVVAVDGQPRPLGPATPELAALLEVPAIAGT